MKLHGQRSLIICAVVILALAAPMLGRANSEYRKVDVEDLAANPQRYWARGIIFTDTLKDISKSGIIKIGEKDYIAISTEEVGLCYLDIKQYDAVNPFPKNEEYIFTGTVLQEERGLFRKRRYLVIVHTMKQLVDAEEEQFQNWRTLLTEAKKAAGVSSLETWGDLLAAVQQNLTVPAAERNMDVTALLLSDNPGAQEEVIASVRGSIHGWMKERKTTGAEILAALILDVLAGETGRYDTIMAAQEAAAEEIDMTTPAPEPEREPEPVIEPEPEPEPVVEPEPEPEPEVAVEPEPMPEPVPEDLPIEEPAGDMLEEPAEVDDEALDAFVNEAMNVAGEEALEEAEDMVETVSPDEEPPAEEDMEEFLKDAIDIEYTEDDIYTPIGR